MCKQFAAPQAARVRRKSPLYGSCAGPRVCPHERPGACSGDGHVPCQFKFKPIQVPSLRRGCLQPVHEVAAIAGEARCHLDLDGAAGESRSKRVDDAGLGRALPLFEETARFRRPTRKSILWFNAFCAMLAVCLCLRGDGQLAPGGFRAGFAAVAGAALGRRPWAVRRRATSHAVGFGFARSRTSAQRWSARRGPCIGCVGSEPPRAPHVALASLCIALPFGRPGSIAFGGLRGPAAACRGVAWPARRVSVCHSVSTASSCVLCICFLWFGRLHRLQQSWFQGLAVRSRCWRPLLFLFASCNYGTLRHITARSPVFQPPASAPRFFFAARP